MIIKTYIKNLKFEKKPNIVGYDIKWENPTKPNLEIETFFYKIRKVVNALVKLKITKLKL